MKNSDGQQQIVVTASEGLQTTIGQRQLLGGGAGGGGVGGFEQYLGLLDQLDVSRPQAYKSMLDEALNELSMRIKSAPQGNLLSLLQASFPFIAIEELKRIPLEILERLSPVPTNYLKLISRDVKIFRQCSPKVQRQVWAMDTGTLRKHVSGLLSSYGEEKATVRRH